MESLGDQAFCVLTAVDRDGAVGCVSLGDGLVGLVVVVGRGAMRREALRLVWCSAKEAPHK